MSRSEDHAHILTESIHDCWVVRLGVALQIPEEMLVENRGYSVRIEVISIFVDENNSFGERWGV